MVFNYDFGLGFFYSYAHISGGDDDDYHPVLPLSMETALMKILMKKNTQVILLSLLVMAGLSKPLLKLYKIDSEILTALNFSPGTLVFSNFRFFSEIRMVFYFPQGTVNVPVSSVIETGSNLYSGKMKYSLIYMDHVFTEEQAKKVARFYLCENKINSPLLKNRGEPLSIRIEYVDRKNGRTIMARTYYCAKESP